MRISWPTRCCLLLSLLAGPTLPLCAQPAGDDAPAQQQAEDKKPVDALDAAIAEVNKQDNGVTINRAERYIDVKGKVCLRAGEFLEMFACTKDTREHESIVVLDAMPSTMHLSLLLLGLEPGKPLSYDVDVNPPKLIPATGPKVKIYVVLKVDGTEIETPANRWVKDNKTHEVMKDNTWLFAGSVQTTYQDKPLYLADVNGSAISLVNFGDDTLTLNNQMTDDNASHNKVWAPNTDAIPKVGTELVIRLRPEAAKDAKDGKDAKESEGPQQPEPADQPDQGRPGGGR